MTMAAEIPGAQDSIEVGDSFPPLLSAPAEDAPPVKRGKRATRTERDNRLSQICALILLGWRSTQITRYASAEWSLTVRQCEWYVSEARRQMEREFSALHEWTLAEHVALRRDMRRRAAKSGDLRMELEAARDEAKLLGLYPATQVGISLAWEERAKQLGYDPSEIERLANESATRIAGATVGADAGDAGAPPPADVGD